MSLPGILRAARPVVPILLAGLPLLGGPYAVYLASDALVWAIAATALALLIGQAGLPSLGQGAFFGVGAYSVALLTRRPGIDPWVALPVALVASGAFAVATGPFVLLRHGPAFLMLTLAFSQLVYAVASQWRSLTQGDDGISGLVRPAGLEDSRTFYLFLLLLLAAVVWVLVRLSRAPVGRVLDAARQNEGKARALGYPVFVYRLASYVVAGTITGLAGAMSAYHRGFVHPESHLSLMVSGTLAIMVLVGGRTYVWGAVAGAAGYKLFEAWVSSRTHLWPAAVGMLLIAVVLWSREGVAGWLLRLSNVLPDPGTRRPGESR